jgi:N-acyl homoserine lactone hydrolase
VLFDTDDGYILVDTGMHVGGLSNPDEVWGERAKLLVPNFTATDDIVNRLNGLGIDADEIKIVINTHLHWDHTGGNRYFTKAKFYVQNAEYRYALYPDKSLGTSYMRNHFDHDLDYSLIEGDVDVADGLRLLFTPGHTPGHQSVIARFKSGNHLIVGGDAVYTNDSINKIIPPGNAYDYQMSVQSLMKLDTLRKLTDAALLPSHEPESDFFTESMNLLEDLEVINGGK